MKYIQSKCKGLAVIVASGVIFAACNSNRSSDTIADTANTITYSSPDVLEQSTIPEDTIAVLQPSDTQLTDKKIAVAKKKVKAIIVMPEVKHSKIKADNKGIYDYAEASPTFPGGPAAIENYVTNNIDYPQTALDYNKEGRLGISFIVDEDGKVTNVRSTGTKLGNGLDEEAVRVVSSMPDWNPGTVNGKPVKTRVTLPITFRIDS